MAKIVVCAVRDSAVGAFARPIFVPSLGVANRSFADEVNRQATDNQIYQHPEDFELFYLGMFDEDFGVFEVEPGLPRMVARGKDLKQS